MRSRIGPKSMREPHQGCASRWASTAAAALCAPSFLYAFAARLATVLIEIPNSAAMSLCVRSRPIRSSVAHSRLVGGSTRVGGERLVTWDLRRPRSAAETLLRHAYSSPPTSVVRPAATRRPTGTVSGPGAYCAQHGQAPPHQGTRAASRRSRPRERQRPPRAGWIARRAGCRQNCRQREIVALPSRAESAHFVRRGRDSNPWEPCDSSGFQDRRIRPLCHPSRSRNANKHRPFSKRGDAGGTRLMPNLMPAPMCQWPTKSPHLWPTKSPHFRVRRRSPTRLAAECPDTRRPDRGRQRTAQRVGVAGVAAAGPVVRGAARERASRIRKLSPEVTTTVA